MKVSEKLEEEVKGIAYIGIVSKKIRMKKKEKERKKLLSCSQFVSSSPNGKKNQFETTEWLFHFS